MNEHLVLRGVARPPETGPILCRDVGRSGAGAEARSSRSPSGRDRRTGPLFGP